MQYTPLTKQISPIQVCDISASTNIPAFVEITACRRPGDRLLSEPINVKLLRYADELK